MWFFPECVARVPVSLWGFGVEGVFAIDVSQPSATVRKYPQVSAWGPYGRAYGECYKTGHFWRFQTSCRLVSRGRRGTLWHFNMCFITRRKSFSVTGAIRLRRFQKMSCIFRVRRSTLDTSNGTFDVCCSVSFANRICRAAWSGDNFATQIPWQAWDVLKIDRGVARNIDFEVYYSKFWSSWENSWGNGDFEATKCEKLRKSRTNC